MTEPDWGTYLSEEERHDIAREEFRAAIRRSTSTANDVERFIGNVAWSAVVNHSESLLPENVDELIAQRVHNQIGELSPFSIFNSGDSLLRTKPTRGWQIAQEAIASNADRIEARVLEVVDGMDEYTVKEILMDWLRKENT